MWEFGTFGAADWLKIILGQNCCSHDRFSHYRMPLASRPVVLLLRAILLSAWSSTLYLCRCLSGSLLLELGRWGEAHLSVALRRASSFSYSHVVLFLHFILVFIERWLLARSGKSGGESGIPQQCTSEPENLPLHFGTPTRLSVFHLSCSSDIVVSSCSLFRSCPCVSVWSCCSAAFFFSLLSLLNLQLGDTCSCSRASSSSPDTRDS